MLMSRRGRRRRASVRFPPRTRRNRKGSQKQPQYHCKVRHTWCLPLEPRNQSADLIRVRPPLPNLPALYVLVIRRRRECHPPPAENPVEFIRTASCSEERSCFCISSRLTWAEVLFSLCNELLAVGHWACLTQSSLPVCNLRSLSGRGE